MFPLYQVAQYEGKKPLKPQNTNKMNDISDFVLTQALYYSTLAAWDKPIRGLLLIHMLKKIRQISQFDQKHLNIPTEIMLSHPSF